MDSKEKKQLARQRREAAKQAQKFHKEQKQKNKSSEKARKKGSVSKIKEAVNSGRASQYEDISREEKFRRESEEKLRHLQPHDFEDGYYIDEYSEKKRAEKRAKEIRKQEKEVIRRNKKPMTSKQVRLKRILISAGIFVAVLIIGIVLSLTVLFKTEKIDIEGDIYYDRSQIIGFSNVAENQNIFIGAMNSTPQDIVDHLPYVESATIGFSIPDTITIKIKNAVPTYAVKDGNGYLIVSSKGRILDTANFKTEELVELICGDIKDKAKGRYIDFGDDSVPEILNSVAKSFAANGVDRIMGFDITDLTQIKINFDNRITINIGLPEDIDYKIKTAFTIINEKLDPNGTGTVTGTLDVSTCNKNKISHYKPSETRPGVPATTAPATTAPADNGNGGTDNGGTDNGGTDNGGTDNGGTGNGGYDNGGYDNGGYDNGGYDNGGYDNGGYDNGGYDNGGYDNGGYDDGGYDNDSYNWQPAE